MSAIAATDNGGMTIQHVSSRCTALIKSEEGYQARRYLCPAGKPTIGYGHVILPRENFPQPMTEAAAEALLLRDLAPVENYLSATFPGINQHQRRAGLLCLQRRRGRARSLHPQAPLAGRRCRRRGR
jgi:GH24 family phage-related lysozyme (muramidase)